jgi:hypothetical protein
MWRMRKTTILRQYRGSDCAEEIWESDIVCLKFISHYSHRLKKTTDTQCRVNNDEGIGLLKDLVGEYFTLSNFYR